MLIFSKSKKNAILLSYISIFLQSVATLFLTRICLDRLGDDTYGLYQMVYAVAQYILILDLGISTVMIRYISEFEVLGDKKKTENFSFHFAVIVIILIAAVVGIGIVINLNIENIYRTLTENEYVIAHRLFRIMIVQICLTIVSHFFRGICEAYERFTFTRSITVIQLVINVALTVIFLESGMGVFGITLANTLSIAFQVLMTALFALGVLKFKIRFHGFDMFMLKGAFLLMIAMLLQAIVGHVNGSVDKTILGIMATKQDVTVYSIAASIITMFNTVPSLISSVFQPAATRLVIGGAKRKELTDFVIKPGRYQFMLIGGFIAAFAVFGRDFIQCWTGKDRISSWVYVLLILVPNAIPLMQNTCLAILNAMDKRIYRSFILAGITIINIGLTILFIKLIGPVGAPLATGIAYVIGHVILMNIYYEKKINIDVKRLFVSIFKGILPCVILTGIVTTPLVLWKCNGSWLVFIAKAVIFTVIYCFVLWKIGMKKEEKEFFLSMLHRFNFRSEKTGI